MSTVITTMLSNNPHGMARDPVLREHQRCDDADAANDR